MALFKCKMCGGSLNATAGETITECEYCGTQQTIPKTTDENVQAMFNRANLLRQKNEFDKAETVYENILVADNTEAEAYWGLLLCKYGIEYVDDPATFKKIPTCHRASYDSILSDDDYISAIEYADASQRIIYEAQAKEIDRIQKDILALAQKEETYDVFICYKETDADGKRTKDSVIANDIYYQLTQEGFKVFYAAITLEDKLGSAYEPIIFSALNSAKVMLVIGTKSEYFNAVWVKNEWARFLKMMRKDRSKMLIPCYKGMDPYDLPEEFAHLQSQDMGKIGFINDVVRGIKKIVEKKEAKTTTIIKETVVTSAKASAEPILKRAFMFLEDGDWKGANEYCEKVLDADPENAQAYLCKLMADLQVRKRSLLRDCTVPFDSNPNYNKVLRFGDELLRRELTETIKNIKTKIEDDKLEEEYSSIIRSLKQSNKRRHYLDISKRFAELGDYKDAQELSQQYFEKAQSIKYNTIVKAMKEAVTEAQYKDVMRRFAEMGDYKDSQQLSQECREKVEKMKNDKLDKQEKKLARKRKVKKIFSTIVFCVFAVVLAIAAYRLIVVQYNFVLLEDGTYALESVTDGYLATSITIPESFEGKPVSKIGSGVFQGKGMLEKVEIPDSVKQIESNAFSGCNSLVEIDLGSVEIIGEEAFYNCVGLQKIVIPKSIKQIGNCAFSNCTQLETIVYNAVECQDLDFASNIFKGCGESGLSVEIGNEVKRVPQNLFTCTYLTWDRSKEVIYRDLYEKYVVSANASGFYAGNTNVQVMPFETWVIKRHSYDAPSTLNVKMVAFAQGSQCQEIGERAFYNATIESVVIPNSVTKICNSAFSGCSSLTSVTISDSVTDIGLSAFNSCSSLSNIIFEGTVEQWNAITKGDNWNASVPATKVTCVNGTVDLQ